MRGRLALIGAAIAVAAPLVSRAQSVVIYTDDFNTNTAANYNIFITKGADAGPSSDATFAYDYGAAPTSGGLAIPAAPHTTDASTLGLRLRVDDLESSSATVVGAIDIATKTLPVLKKYSLQVDVWSNYIGNGTDISSSGSNGSTGVAVGVGTNGTTIQYAAANNGMLVEAFGDNGGGANRDYRVYADNTAATPTNSPYYNAGTSSSSATNTDPYYTSKYPSVSAPAGQSTFLATQGGSTAAGTQGFAWHTWIITNDGTNVTWAIDGKTITTVPVASLTFAGGQISLGNDDTGLTGSSAANNQLFNAEIFDNLSYTALPEPGSLGLLGLGGIALLKRRRKWTTR